MKTLLRSFAGGEITPELYGRIDLTKYQTGLALCKNFLTLPHGPLYRRPGFQFLAEASVPPAGSSPVRLIPFSYSATAAAVLEFSNFKVRIFIDGQLLVDETRTITDINPTTGVVTVNSSTLWTDADEVFIGGRQLRITTLSGTTFTVKDFAGNQVFLPETLEGQTVSHVYWINGPYAAADLAKLKYAQDNDTLTLTHPSYPAYELRRVSALNWQLSVVSFTPTVPVPTGVGVTATVAVTGNQAPNAYVVTSLADDGVSESLPSVSVQVSNNLSAAGNYNTVRHDFMPGISRYRVYKRRGGIFGFVGTTTVAVGVSVASATWASNVVTISTSAAHGLSVGDEVDVTGFAPSGINGRATIATTPSSTQFTFARTGSGTVTTLGTYSWYRPVVDDNVAPDTTVTPPENTITLNGSAGNYPEAVTYYEQRRWFAATDLEPQTVWATRNGTQSNLTSSFPSRDDDGLKFRIAAQQQNRIRHLVPLGDLIAFTTGGEFRVYADNAPAITPTSLSVKPQGYNGASDVRPVATSGSILYVQAQGSRVRELAYNWQNSAYASIDVSLLAPHLFDGFTILDMAYSRAPVPTLWAVRSDGVLLGMTYVPDQQVYGWHQHHTDGVIESVCVVAEGLEDAVYVLVRRTIGNAQIRYVERLNARFFEEQSDAFFVDSGLTYRGAPVTTLSNLWHLEGKTVQILADGAVAPERVVVNGQITLNEPASVVHVGLRYEADAQTLPLAFEANAGGQYAQKNVNAIAIRVARSSLVKAGPSFSKLVEYPAREVSDPYGSPPQLQTGQLRMAVPPSWNADGALCLRQDQPLPLTVLSIALDVAGGG